MGIKWKCFEIDCAMLYAHSSLQVSAYDNKLTIAYHLLMEEFWLAKNEFYIHVIIFAKKYYSSLEICYFSFIRKT
jgi:hypothetical protein